ncbi:MAG: patatin-like phospholipase family protein, partial [Bdellovibrionaceae bacterium]|nr:patatin-like phospholipase family protein [Pseudobdellovibrionaceae bacterium]
MYIGSSAGAFVCSLLANGFTPEAIINAFNRGANYPKILADYKSHFPLPTIRYRNIFRPNIGNWIHTSLKFPITLIKSKSIIGRLEAHIKHFIRINGFFTTDAIEEYLRYQALAHDRFDELGVELYIVATQLNHTRKAVFGPFPKNEKTDETIYINYARISEAVAASAALPPFFAPKRIARPDGKLMSFFDGEIRDTLSTHFAEEFGAKEVIASYSTHPYHYSEKTGSLDQYGLPVIINQALYQVIQQKITRAIRHKRELKKIYDRLIEEIQRRTSSEDQRLQWMEVIDKIFWEEAGFKPQTKWIYIHPAPKDAEMFFTDHFSLNPKLLERIVGIGYRAALSAHL